MPRIYSIGSSKNTLLSGMSVNTKLILINVVAFIIVFPLMILEKIPIDYVAIKPISILQGQYLWTFLTSMFMHGGFLHLFVNKWTFFITKFTIIFIN